MYGLHSGAVSLLYNHPLKWPLRWKSDLVKLSATEAAVCTVNLSPTMLVV